MDKAKQQLLEQTHKIILEEGLKSKNPERLLKITGPNIVGLGTTYDEKIIGLEDLRILLKRQQEQGKNLSFSYDVTNLGTHISKDENTAVSTNEIDLSITTDGETISMLLRFSVVLEYLQNKWILVHFHSSKPEEVESEKDTWGIETWKEKAEELEKEVAERTADLILKNRDLAIEAALERVRARSMAMHSSDELNEVVAVLFENLKELEIPVTAAGIQVYLEDSEDMLNYVCGENSEGLVISHYRMPYFDNPIINDFKNARDKKDGFFVGNYSKKIKDSFYTYLFENTEIKDVPEDIKQMIFESRAYTISMAPVSNSLIAINDFQGNQLSENNVAIIKRFAKAFEQAYIRFRDLQKAEAQAREAQIEAALERVRNKALAMHSSEDISLIVNTFFNELKKLNISMRRCGVGMVDLETKVVDVHVTTETHTQDSKMMTGKLTLSGHYVLDKIFETFKTKEEYHPVLSGKDLTDYYRAMNSGVEYPEFSFDETQYGYYFHFKEGGVFTWSDKELPEEDLQIFRKYTSVLSLTYRRYLDLKESEAQTREAQIEAALEKVRSRSMAMHNSQELKEVALELRKQMGLLGQKDLEVCAIHLYGNDEDSFESWSAMKASGSETEIVQTQAHFPKRGIRIVDEMVHHYTIGTKDYILVNEGEKIAEWFKVLKKHAPELHSSILDSIGKVPVKQQKANWAVADFSGGALVMVTYGEPDEVSRNLLRRSANVFEQAYVRFLDLQKAEAQAREAQIETALEKVRSRSMGMQKSTELLEVITVVSQQLQTLGFRFSHVSFINNSLKEQNSFWVAATGLPNPMRFIIPYKAMPMIDNLRKAQKNKDPFYTNVSTIKEHQEWFKHLLKHSGENVFPKEIIDYQMSKGLARSISIHTNIMLALANTQSEPYSDDENKIIARFGQVFEQSYTRFLDLQRAEAQAKEAQIEAALERVRSRSMGMQKSEELEEIIQVVFDQFIQLGITVDHSGFIMDYKSRDDMHIWLADQHKITSQITLPYFDSPHWNSYNEAKKNGDNLFLNHLNFKEKNTFYKQIFKYVPNLPEEAKAFYLECPSLTIATTLADNIGLYIENYSGIQYSEEDQKTLIRFGRVFQQTYTRFLDLKKAEAQAREAQIEAALEKVRSRTMAMQKSEELPLAANNLFLQVQELGIPAWSAGYCIWQDDKHNANCNMSSEGEIQKGFVLPSIGEGYDFYTPQEKGEHFYVKALGGEALVQHYEFMKQLPNMGEILKELTDAGLELPTFQIFHIVYFKFGYVMFITYEEVPEAHDIFKRFGQVFEQTYTRFLDLERAEAQAREARIEMALEKVRSRTMAMQHSNELREAAQLLFNEVRALGIPSWSCGYNILSDDKKSAECWMSSEGTLQKPFTLVYEKEVSFIEMYDFFKGDDTFLIQELSGTALQSHYDYLKSFPNLVPIFNDLQKAEISLPTYQINHLCKFSQGYLLFITYEPVPEAHELFVRFTKVFEQTYTRFLDLKQAEARARESQIQTALERVRSHSMGMQSTADFANVTTEMFNQLRSFGEDLFATGIVFCDKHEGHVEQWHSIPGAGMLSPMIVPTDLDYIHQYRYDQWKSGTTLFSIEIPSDFIEQHFEAIFKLPSAQVTLKDLESRNAPMPAPPAWEIDYGASFKHGYILVSSLKPLENTDILPRFAQVFEQAYIRFLDLQKAEAQARESQIEAALEKVRSRTLAMQKSDELADTSVVVFKELLDLGIEPNRLFIGIVKDNGDAIEAWATNEDGSKIEQHFKLYTSKNKSIKKMVDGWKQQKKSTIIDMQGKELQEYFHYLNKVMQIPFIDGLKQKRRVQSIAYFSGGLIGMAAPEEQPEETINLLERFAAVFNLTYTRFNDLKIAEAQAEQAEQDLINLQKAKKNAEKALAELQNTQKQLIQSEKMASLGELTAGIAHEIQNPLNFVNNFSEVSKELLAEMLEEIENGDMDEVRAIMNDVIQNLEKINHHGKRADGIVKGMLQHSRASGDKKESTDINALVDEYLRLAYHGLRAKDKSFNAQLVTNFDESIGKVGIIPQDIGRVVLNLLTNAFYAVNEKNKMGIDNYEPTVAVRTKKIKDNIEIEVTDNGNGMPASVKQKIFQPFFTTKPPGQGTGLGLSMSYDIITKGHGGELKVETKEGKGTIFILELPL